jgi:hypothetical protein
MAYLIQICKKWVKELAFAIHPAKIFCIDKGGFLGAQEPPPRIAGGRVVAFMF